MGGDKQQKPEWFPFGQKRFCADDNLTNSHLFQFFIHENLGVVSYFLKVRQIVLVFKSKYKNAGKNVRDSNQSQHS